MKKLDNRISLPRARAFVLSRQLLDGGGASGKAGAMRAINRLGYVQIDTISVVERAHHHTLWARVPGYRPEVLDVLQRERKAFEYWAHAMCYLPMGDYRYYRRYMEEFPNRSEWFSRYHRKYGQLTEEVLARVRNEGPLTAGDFADVPGRKRGAWWDWKPAKAALEMLFYRGDLMVAERRGFQRVYDLTERVLPGGAPAATPGEVETRRFFVRRALGAMGLATEKEVNKHITIAGKLGAQLAAMEKSGEVRRVNVEGSPKPYYMLDELSGQLGRKIEIDDQAKLLSPFDNAIILRERTKELFGFDFAIECYTPAAKRKYGYFSLPILWRNGLVGRLDPKADRGTGTLRIRNIHLERPIKDKAFYRVLAQSLMEYAGFNRCVGILMENGEIGPARMLGKYL